jgi:hypothetical protein
MKYIFTLLILSFTYQIAYGCSSPPKDYFYTPEELIGNSDGIFLAKAVSSTAIENEYAADRPPTFSKVKLEIVDVLKGSSSGKAIEMKGFNLNGEESYDYGNHDLKQFWERPMVGSGVAPGDCWAYGVYEVGSTYLIFSGVGHIKAFEPIRDAAKDKWLLKIKELLSGAS